MNRNFFLLLGNATAILFFLLCALVVTAQSDSPGYYTKGNALFKQKNYYEAIKYY